MPKQNKHDLLVGTLSIGIPSIILLNAGLHVCYFVRICTSGSENRALASFQRGVIKNFGNKSIHWINFKLLVLFLIRL